MTCAVPTPTLRPRNRAWLRSAQRRSGRSQAAVSAAPKANPIDLCIVKPFTPVPPLMCGHCEGPL